MTRPARPRARHPPRPCALHAHSARSGCTRRTRRTRDTRDTRDTRAGRAQGRARKRKRSRRKPRLPQGYDPSLPNGGLPPPDPERWLPK